MAQQVGKQKLFTPQMIERLRPPSAGRLEIADSNCPGLVLRVLILTGQRRSEWAKAQRSEIDIPNRWLEVPRGRYKGARDHVVPLTAA